jgi:endoglucanase
MKKYIIAFVIALYLSVSTDITFCQGFLKVQGKQIVNEKNENVLLRGIGLGGWMLQEPYMFSAF